MQSVIDLTRQAMDVSAEHGRTVATRMGIPGSDHPAGAFPMCYNHAALTLELLSFYKRIWARSRRATPAEITRAREENGQRVVMATKAMFILCLSAIEFSAKQALMNRPGTLALGDGRIYLRNIVQESNGRGYIAEQDKNLWWGATEVRNCVVHNNGIADVTAEWSYPDLTVSMNTGTMMRANLEFFPRLTVWALNAFERWTAAVF